MGVLVWFGRSLEMCDIKEDSSGQAKKGDEALFPLSYEITSLWPLPTDHLLNMKTPIILTVLYLNSLNENNKYKIWTSKICSPVQIRRYDVGKQVYPYF